MPAFVAGFFLVLMMQRPGMANLPTLFTSHVHALMADRAPRALSYQLFS
jgi:hypothetical protein